MTAPIVDRQSSTSPTTITFLGTSSVVPAGGHDTATFVINGKYLVDTGWYAPIKMKSHGLDPLALEYLLLSHCHHDHYLALPQVLFYLRMRASERPGRPPIKIVGPAQDLERVVTLARRLLQPERFPDVDPEVELRPLEPGQSLDDPAFRVDTCSTAHPVQGLCYRFTDKRTGAVFAYTGDTAYHPPIVEHVVGVRLLIHEASYGPVSSPSDPRWGHSGAPEAARVAKEAAVGRLALVHCSEDKQTAALAAARAIFPNAFWPADGQTVEVV